MIEYRVDNVDQMGLVELLKELGERNFEIVSMVPSALTDDFIIVSRKVELWQVEEVT